MSQNLDACLVLLRVIWIQEKIAFRCSAVTAFGNKRRSSLVCYCKRGNAFEALVNFLLSQSSRSSAHGPISSGKSKAVIHKRIDSSEQKCSSEHYYQSDLSCKRADLRNRSSKNDNSDEYLDDSAIRDNAIRERDTLHSPGLLSDCIVVKIRRSLFQFRLKLVGLELICRQWNPARNVNERSGIVPEHGCEL